MEQSDEGDEREHFGQVGTVISRAEEKRQQTAGCVAIPLISLDKAEVDFLGKKSDTEKRRKGGLRRVEVR